MPRLLLPLLVLACLGLTGCAEPEPTWDIAADGSCDPAQLQVAVVPRVDPDPALVVVDVVITNVSGTTCRLSGAPTVTITDAYRTQPIGGPAATMPGDTPTVQLPPRGVAYLLVQTLQSMADTPTCVGVIANGMHILLPGRTDAQAIVTSSPVAKYCAEPSRGTLLASPITAAPLVVAGVADYLPKP